MQRALRAAITIRLKKQAPVQETMQRAIVLCASEREEHSRQVVEQPIRLLQRVLPLLDDSIIR